MPPVDWQQAWRERRTPWDAGKSPPALYDLLEGDHVPGGRVLVPGCGTGYDLATLARDDREVVGIDVSEDARASFLASHVNLPGKIVYEVTDFFSYHPSEPFDFVWDYTFFCALEPEQRADWADAMKRLVKPNALLATLLFPLEEPLSERQGPPWPINTELVLSFIAGAFEQMNAWEPERSHRGREGRERLVLWRRRER